MPSASISSSLPQKTSDSRLWAAWDGAGAFASILCMIHCVGFPILLAAFPGLTSALPAGVIKDETFHQVVAIIATVLALSAFTKGYREHRLRRVIVLGVVGCALLIIAAYGAASGLEHETAWTVVGSVLLVVAHFFNYRKMHARSHAHVREHGHSQCHGQSGQHH